MNASITPRPGSQSFASGVGRGFLFVLAHCVGGVFVAGIVSIIPKIGPFVAGAIGISILGIGLSQLAYVIPICRGLKQKGELAAMKGHITAAAIVALLNASCWGVLATSWRGF